MALGRRVGKKPDEKEYAVATGQIDGEVHFDAIVVGSGFGGSVMAYRLAEAAAPYPPERLETREVPWRLGAPSDQTVAGSSVLAAARRRSSSRTMGATSVPKSSMARMALSWGSAPTLIWAIKRSLPKSSYS